MTRDDVVAEARRWIGTPYRPQGRSARGLDCIGLLVMLGRAFGIPHVDEAAYGALPSEERALAQRLDAYLVRVPPDADRRGLVCLFAERRLPGHVGVGSWRDGQPHLIHARLRSRAVLEEPWATAQAAGLRLVQLYALPGTED